MFVIKTIKQRREREREERDGRCRGNKNRVCDGRRNGKHQKFLMGAVYKKLSEAMHHVQGRFILSGTFEADLDTPGYVARNAATVKHKGKREEKIGQST